MVPCWPFKGREEFLESSDYSVTSMARLKGLCLHVLLFSPSLVSDSLHPHGLQHTRLSCPSLSPGVSSDSCPLSRWCHPAISSFVAPLSCLQSFPASGYFQISQCFSLGGQNIGVSASASVLPMNIQDWFLLGCTGWISLQSKGLSRVFSNTTVQKHQFFCAQLSSQSNSHLHTLTAWRALSPTLCFCHPVYISLTLCVL